MKTKEEVIKEAYKEHFEKCDVTNNGYSRESNIDFYPDIEWHPTIPTLWRPFGLKGIEDNNGWTPIEAGASIPDTAPYYQICANGKSLPLVVNYGKLLYMVNFWDATHYREYVPIHNPVY